MRRPRRLDCLQADKTPDAVVDMNDKITAGERARFCQNVLRAPLALRLTDKPIAENVLLADDGEVRRFEPLFERDDGKRQRARTSSVGLMIGRNELERLEPMLGQHVAEPLARAIAPTRSEEHT